MTTSYRNLIECQTEQQRIRALLEAVEAERDAARAEAESTWRCFHCGFCTTNHAKALAHFGDHDEEMALCRWWNDSTDAERVQALQDAIEQQNAAQAGEARAVEALRKIREEFASIASRTEEEVRNDFTYGYAHGWGIANLHVVGIIGNAADTPALTWLAQREREAAAKALSEAHRDICQHAVQHEYSTGEKWTWSDAATYCFDRAAALRAGKGGE